MRYVILKTEELEALEKLHKNSDNKHSQETQSMPVVIPSKTNDH